jgi:putative ATP-dependent endonuclease of the OLD family
VRLLSGHIQRFRSIGDVDIPNCGAFNVLIGKNNSGKSALLSSISGFFDCLKDGDIVTLRPPFSREIDFFNREISKPIEITLTFELSADEQAKLTRDIAADAPQMRYALDTLEPALKLSVMVSILPPPREFGYVSRMWIHAHSDSSGPSPHSDRPLLDVSLAAAEELRERLQRAQQSSSTAGALRNFSRRFDEDDWTRLRAEFETQTPRDFLRYYLTTRMPASEMTSSATEALSRLIRQTESFGEFQQSLQSLLASTETETAELQRQPLNNAIGTFAGEEPAVPHYAQELLAQLAQINVLYLTENRRPIGRDEAARLLRLKVQRGGTDILRGIQQTVATLLGVTIDAFEGSATARLGQPSAELDVDNFLIEVNGSGIREALRLILDVTFEQPQIFLVEEPEVHLHPALETSVMRFLKQISAERQVFLSTHSTNFLDTGDMENVYLVEKKESTQVRQLDLYEAERALPIELGIRLSSLFLYDRLLFVEGPTDEDILREWAAKLNINLSQANVGFIIMQGSRNFGYFAAEATVDFLTRRNVAIWFLIDRDERDDADITALKDRLKNKSQVRILDRREIENYLINPRTILDFINQKRLNNSNHNVQNEQELTISNVEAEIDAAAESLQQMVIDKRVAYRLCKPIYMSQQNLTDQASGQPIIGRLQLEVQKVLDSTTEIMTNAESVVNEITDEVANIWPNNKLKLVPGDLLIDRVCQKFGVRFRKKTDAAKLAALMTVNEIPDEMRSFLIEVGS